MTIVNGKLLSAVQKNSPHFNQRPQGQIVELLVVHNISLPAGCFSGHCVEDFFCDQLDCSSHPSFKQLQGLKVSAHLFIRRNAQVIQFVNFNHRAWHAGLSSFNGRENCNDFSIGIELEGSDFVPFTKRQYKKLSQVTLEIMRSYPQITIENICGHNHIAPGRKTDPGPFFDWLQYKQSLSCN
jgi:N-acetyl-anhydromuramoyl-L-alanine amidase